MSLPATRSAAQGRPGTRCAVTATNLVKVYGAGDTSVRALDGVSVAFRPGEFTAVLGPSGSGKSTLMHCLAGLDTPTSGSVRIAGAELAGLPDKALTRLRAEHVGFVFQSFNLLPTLTAEQNILLPCQLAGRRPDPAYVRRIVEAVGLGDRLRHTPNQLSGGQQQRVACARALVSRPTVVFADEPTGNLDSRSGAEVLGLLARSVAELDQTVVMVTHDAVAAGFTDRALVMADGRLVDELVRPTADVVLDRMKTLGG